jgi:hypothetical protein
MNLTGGGVMLRVRDITKSPFSPSLGQIEELVNNTPGRLDLDPFHPGGANSFFDVLFEIELPDGTILHNEQPVRIQAVISEKPWNTCFHFILPPESPVVLYDEANQPTEVNLVQGCVFCPGGTITVDDVTVNEDAGVATFNVTLSNPSSFPVTVNYSTADGTATAGIDYTAVPPGSILLFSPGETTRTISVPISEDLIYEGDETFYVDLSNPANAAIADGQGMGTIVDDDLEPALSIDDVAESEDGGAATFTVTLSNPSAFPVTVNYSTADGTGTAGIDYTAVSGTLTFNPGDIFKIIPVLIVDDSVYEGDETFYVDLSNPANATIIDGQGMGTIVDNDLSPELMIEALIEDIVDAPDLPESTKTSLIASLDTAIKVLGDSNPKNDVAAFNVLRAFIKKVGAQCDKKIPEEVADALIAKAQDIIVVLSLGP